MTQVMHHVILFLSAFSCVFCNTDAIGISVTPSLDAGPINWNQAITITCTWTPGRGKFADILVGDESIYSHSVYADIVNQENPEARLFFSQDETVGTAQLVIKDITKEDENKFTCSVSRIGPGGSVTLEVLEPPTAGVTGLAAIPEFTSVQLTWEAVEGATNYNVAYRAAGTEAWTDVDVAGTEHTFEGLNVASDYEAKATASNPAGIREGIEPAETTFTTKDNRPPHPVGGLNVHEAEYNATSITLSWELQDNIDENRIITGITAAAVKEGATDEEPAIESQELSADATSVTFELPGPGDYVFTITTNNDYSADVETSATEIHTVKETTDPPVEPTTPEPTVKPTTEPKKEPTTAAKDEPDVEIDIGDGGETIVCGDTRSIQPLANTEATLKCMKHDDSDIAASDIVWSFKAGEADAVEQDQIIASEIGIVSHDNDTSYLKIKNVDANSVGFWKCRYGNTPDTREFCSYSVELTGATTGGNSGTALVCSGTVILAALIASLLH